MDAPALHVETFDIALGATFCFETDSAPGVDPVAHLLAPTPGGGWQQVAVHDDVQWPGDPDVALCWTNTLSTMPFLLVLRAFTSSGAGVTATKVNGQPHRTGVAVGGALMFAWSIERQPGDQLRTAQLPGGSVAQALFRLSGVYAMEAVAMANGPALSANLTAAAGDAYYLLGTPHYAYGATVLQPRAGAVRLTSNDVAQDADDDGLGDFLEAELQTCAQPTGCAHAANGHGRDSDRDGVRDVEEVYGIEGTDVDGLDDLALSRWGANPRKKDVFVEVDHVGKLGTLPAGTNPFTWMRNHPAEPLGWWSSGISPEAWVDKLRQPFLVAPADHVHNPDGTAGIEIHADIGVQPLAAADEAKFGDWGGLSQRVVVEDQRVEVAVTGPGDPPGTVVTVPTFVSLQVNSSSRMFNALGMDASEVCYGLMFQLLVLIVDEGEPVQLVEDGCGAAKPFFRFGSQDPALAFESGVSAWPAWPNDPVQVALLTSGLGFDALHFGFYSLPDYRDDARRGRIRYAIAASLTGGGKGGGSRLAAGLDHHSAFTHELGHTLALQHWGHGDWDTEGVACIPQYFSLMRYGVPETTQMGNPPAPVSNYHFAQNDAGWTLNPAQTVETATFGATFDHGIYAGNPFYYPKPPTAFAAVDWNRDLVQGDANTGWRSTALAIPGYSCEAFSQAKQVLGAPSEAPTDAADLQRVGSRLYAFWVSGGQHLRYRHAGLALGSDKSCTGSANPLAPGSCLTWSATTTLISDGSAPDAMTGVTATVHDSQLFLATRSSAHGGRLRIWRCAVAGDGTLSVLDQTDAHEHPAGLYAREYRSAFAPELVPLHQTLHNRTLGLLYTDFAGTGTVRTYRHYGWNGTDWLHLGPMLDTAGQPLVGRLAPAAKAWPGAELAWAASERRTLAVLPDADDKLRVYALVPNLDRWLHLTTLNVQQHGTAGRPFLEYRAVRDATGAPTADFRGHFLIGRLIDHPDSGHRASVLFSSVVSRTAPPSLGTTPQLWHGSLWGWLQNEWARQIPGTTAALYSDPVVDNVFGLAPLATGNPGDSGLVFYPHADGSPDWPLTTYSDFKVMEDGVCEGLMGDGPPYAPVCGYMDHKN